MSDRCGGTPVKSTLWNALNKTGTLPELKIVTARGQQRRPGCGVTRAPAAAPPGYLLRSLPSSVRLTPNTGQVSGPC